MSRSLQISQLLIKNILYQYNYKKKIYNNQIFIWNILKSYFG